MSVQAQPQPAELSIPAALYKIISLEANTLANMAAAVTQLNTQIDYLLTILNEQQQQQPQPSPAPPEQPAAEVTNSKPKS